MMRAGWAASTAVRVVAAASVLVLLACGGVPRPANTVVYASGADLESANPLVTVHPLSRQVQRYMLFVTLARYGDNLEPEPYFARSWEWSPDRRTLTLHLFDGLRWHDGAPTTARDAAFTIQAARDPATGYARYADLAEIASASAPDDGTLVLAFARPQASFPVVLCELPIVPVHKLGATPRSEMRHAAFNLAPVGNGPFRFVERLPAQRWTFARNPDFPAELGGPPTLARVVVAVVDEATTKFAGLVSGDLDVAGIAPTMAALVARDPSLRVIDYPGPFTIGIVFNVAKPPFDDARVRRAVSLAIDRKRIVVAALAGFATPAFGPVAPAHRYALTLPTARDTALADSLLDAAGWRRVPGGPRVRAGKPLIMELLTVGSADNATEQLVQADMASIGIRLEIRQREMTSFLAAARASRRQYDALITSISGDVSLAYLTSMFDSRLAGGALDYGGYHTPRLDSLLAAARLAPGDSVARAAWIAVQRELAAQVPVAWIYHARGVQGVARRLHGVTMDLRGEMVSIARWSVGDPVRRAARIP